MEHKVHLGQRLLHALNAGSELPRPGLRASFRPAAAMVPLRSYLRQRAILVEELTARIQRMQKALTEMNLMLHTVVSDITGVTGLKIIHAILAGERDPERLAVHRDGRCHASHQELVAALTGNYREEHLFSLRQNFTAYQFHLQQIAECDTEIEALLNTLAAQQPPPSAALPAPRAKTTKKHAPAFDIRTPLHGLTGGADLSQIDMPSGRRPHCKSSPRSAPTCAAGPPKSTSLMACLDHAGPQQQDLRRAPAQLSEPHPPPIGPRSFCAAAQ